MSMKRVVNLCRNGNAFITNIKVACDARENLRRMEEEELTMVRDQRLDVEKKSAEKLFGDVSVNFTILLSCKTCLQMHPK